MIWITDKVSTPLLKFVVCVAYHGLVPVVSERKAVEGQYLFTIM